MSRIRAIVFDFDGVVLESADVKTDAFVELYTEYGPDVVARVRAHHLENLGISRFKKFEWIAANVLGTHLSESDSKALGERFSALALHKVLTVPFVPGATATIPMLRERCATYVASGTPEEELRMIVARREISPWFDEVHGTPREKPVILRDLMERFALEREQILFVGDGMSDYKAAREVGVEFLARDTPALHEDWLKLGVRRVPDLSSLLEVVASW